MVKLGRLLGEVGQEAGRWLRVSSNGVPIMEEESAACRPEQVCNCRNGKVVITQFKLFISFFYFFRLIYLLKR